MIFSGQMTHMNIIPVELFGAAWLELGLPFPTRFSNYLQVENRVSNQGDP